MKIFELPEAYSEVKTVDLMKNKKLAVLVNILSLVIAGVVFLVGYLISPLHLQLVNYDQPFKPLLSILIVVALLIEYILLHELTHGIFFKVYSGKRAKYGFNGLYAYAKSEAYFNKKEFLIIGLSPVVIFGILCLCLNLLLGQTFFWYIYAVQIINLSGAAGDFYVTWALCRLPKDVLVHDEGVSMAIYQKLK